MQVLVNIIIYINSIRFMNLIVHGALIHRSLFKSGADPVFQVGDGYMELELMDERSVGVEFVKNKKFLARSIFFNGVHYVHH